MKKLYKCKYCNTLSTSKKKLLEHEKNCPEHRMRKFWKNKVFQGVIHSPLELYKQKNIKNGDWFVCRNRKSLNPFAVGDAYMYLNKHWTRLPVDITFGAYGNPNKNVFNII